MNKTRRYPAFPGDDPYELVWFGRPIPLRVWVLHWVGVLLRVPFRVSGAPFGSKPPWRPTENDDGTANL